MLKSLTLSIVPFVALGFVATDLNSAEKRSSQHSATGDLSCTRFTALERPTPSGWNHLMHEMTTDHARQTKAYRSSRHNDYGLVFTM